MMGRRRREALGAQVGQGEVRRAAAPRALPQAPCPAPPTREARTPGAEERGGDVEALAVERQLQHLGASPDGHALGGGLLWLVGRVGGQAAQHLWGGVGRWVGGGSGGMAVQGAAGAAGRQSAGGRHSAHSGPTLMFLLPLWIDPPAGQAGRGQHGKG